MPPASAPWLRHIGRMVGLAIGDEAANPPAIDPSRHYELAELIDLAQRTNPETRIAWERAREAALAVGIAEAVYAPMLAAKAAGYQRVPPLPKTILTPDGFFTADTQVFLPALTMKWQLFDVGGSDASADATSEALAAANFGFNETHQKVAFEVTRAYYALNAVQGRGEVARISLGLARTLESAAQSRHSRGLATLPEVLQAQERSARAAYELQESAAGETGVRTVLLDAMGLQRSTPLRVASLAGRRLRARIEGTAERLIDTVIAQEPELLARVVAVRAREAGIRKAQAEPYPRLGNAGDLGPDAWQPARPSPGEFQPGHDRVARQVVRAYEELKDALSRREAAVALLTVSERSYGATIDSYRNGSATFVDVSNAQAALIKSRAADIDTRSSVFAAATALAFSTGDLVQP